MAHTMKLRIVTVVALVLLAIGAWSLPYLRPAGTLAGTQDGIGNVPERTNLQLCVQGFDGTAVPPNIIGKITAALAKVKNHPDFERAGLNRGGGPTVLRGCPDGPSIKSARRGPNVITKPSPIFTFVFIASQEELQGLLFKRYPRVTSQETQCEGDKCREVTKAVYLTPQELGNEQQLVSALTSGVGLLLPNEEIPLYTDGVTPDDKSKQ